ncbi:MAG: hypothetical protein IKW90_14955 [Lachnospiraceae bacterium]|nr:hypothetical protein [Lachnospiraceae bacterium]
MPTRVEEICKQIHILFAKGEAYQNSPDLVILSKTEMFALLQELNEAMYEVLDQYEATTRAKEMARLETEREASEIIAKAKIGAEDVQAVSLAYTDTMLDEMSMMIDNTTQFIRNQYLEFLAAMDEKQEGLKADRTQIQEKLRRLHDSDNYLKLLEEVREDRETEKEETENSSANKDRKGSKNIASDNQSVSEDENEFPPPPKAPEPVIRVNRPGENSGVTFTTRRSHNKKSKTAPPKSSRAQAMSEEEYNMLSPEQQEALENSTPAYGQGYTADDFDLDAEYEQFKAENQAAADNSSSKKGGFKLFGKKKK